MRLNAVLDDIRRLLRADYAAVVRVRRTTLQTLAASGHGDPSRRILLRSTEPTLRDVTPADRTAYAAGAAAVAVRPIPPTDALLYATWPPETDPPDPDALDAAARLLGPFVPDPHAPDADILPPTPPAPDVIPTPLGPAVFRSPALRNLLDHLRLLADAPDPVLLVGEPGSGKTLTAAALHTLSGRPGPFLHTSVGDWPDSLIETVLFGAVEGAFTGARNQPGLIEAADRGTLLIDEVGDLAPPRQVALLRVIESGQVFRVGETRPRRVDVRFVLATARPEGLRPDLRGRCVATLRLPPLRERPEDAVAVAELAAAELGLRLEPAAAEAVARIDWPGHLRDVRATVRLAALIARRRHSPTVDVDDLDEARRLRTPEVP